MIKPTKRWHISEFDSIEIDEISKTNGIHPLIAKILVQRGIKTKEEVFRFLNIDLSLLHDPFLLNGMAEAVKRIQTAIIKNEKILIYGDYDADGITSTTLLYKTLKILEADISYYIPNRFSEGYGVNADAVIQAANDGVTLIITVDTGITAVEEARLAKELGMTLIITDHHEPPAVLPDAFAVINPKKPGDPYPFKHLAGVGVAFKLAHGLLGRIPAEFIDIAAIGTIADMVPLVDENRMIASMGLAKLKTTEHIGLQALIRKAGLSGREITAGHVGFAIGPRINASGRLDSADHAVRLLLSDDNHEAEELLGILEEMNQERQYLVEEAAKEALQILKEQNMEQDKVLVLAKEGWHVGIIGIVASRILEKFYRPTIILSIDPVTNTAKGSARSIEGYDIYQALSTVKELLPHFGGHPAAAGLSIRKEDIGPLRGKLNELAENWLSEEDFIPIQKVDASCTIHDIDISLIQQIEAFAPFGIGNPSPVFLIDPLEVKDLTALGKNKQHLRLNVENQRKSIEAILFKRGELFYEAAPYSKAQLIGEFSINEWKGRMKPQIIVKDIHIPDLQVFDWRNNKTREERLKELSVQKPLIFYDEQSDSLDPINQGMAVSYKKWDHLNEIQTNTLILFSLPPSLEQLKRILRSNRNWERIYCLFGDQEKDVAYNFPIDRNLFKRAYIELKAVEKEKKSVLDLQETEYLLKNLGIRSELIQFILEVFSELGFIIMKGDMIHLHPNPERKELNQSKTYKKMVEEKEAKELLLNSSHERLKEWFSKQMEDQD